MHSLEQPTLARLLTQSLGALTVIVFLFGLESSLGFFRFDSLPAGAVDGAIVDAVASKLVDAGRDVCDCVRMVQLVEVVLMMLMADRRW